MYSEIFRIGIEVKYQKGGNGLWNNWICVGDMNGGDSACSGNRYILIYPPDKQNSEFNTNRYSDKASIKQQNYHFDEGKHKLDNGDGKDDYKFRYLVNLEGNWTATLFSNENNSEYPGHKTSKFSREKIFIFYVKIESDMNVEILDTQVLFLFIKLYGKMVADAAGNMVESLSDFSIKTGRGNFFSRSKGHKRSSYYIRKGRSYGKSQITTSPLHIAPRDTNKEILSTMDSKGDLIHTDECTTGRLWTRFQHNLSVHETHYRRIYRHRALQPGGNKRIRYKTKKIKRNKQVKRVKRTKKYRTNKNKYRTNKNKYITKKNKYRNK